MSINRQVRGENRFYMAPPMRKLQQEREKKRLEAEEEKRKAKDLLITNSSNSVRQYSDSIPADILIDIFLRVPAKSIGKFRCVSKFWKSILGRPDFTELFLTKSVASTRLFFAVKDKEELLVFSSPQPLNPNNNSCLVATHYKSFPKHFPNGVLEICNSLCGFVFLQSLSGKQRVICNSVTGECITLRSLPNVTSNRIMGNYLGFDPINKQFKVLCMTWSRNGTPNTHWVLTLGTGKRIWRTIQDPFVFHYARCRICINGVLYYIADFDGSYYEIVCFDFRFEKFSLINIDGDMLINNAYGLILVPGLTLFNHKGKLGAYTYQPWGNEELLALWVVEDARKHKWSKRVCVLPTFRNNILKNQGYYIIGMTVTGEIVFTPYLLSNPFYIFYYNIERTTFTRVNIQGFEEFEDHPIIFTSLDYVESVQGFIT